VVACEDDLVFAGDVARTQCVNADLAGFTRRIALAAVRTLGELAVGLDLLEQAVRGATRGVALAVVVCLDEFDVVARQVLDGFADDVDQCLDTASEVRRVEDRNVLACGLERLEAVLVEAGRPGDVGDARVGTDLGVLDGRFGAGEVDDDGGLAVGDQRVELGCGFDVDTVDGFAVRVAVDGEDDLAVLAARRGGEYLSPHPACCPGDTEPNRHRSPSAASATAAESRSKSARTASSPSRYSSASRVSGERMRAGP